jgi:hypothetical protein
MRRESVLIQPSSVSDGVDVALVTGGPFQMFQGYIFRRTVEGIHIIHLGKTWEKLMVAARMQLGNSEHVSISCVFFWV